jgi:hypothetical protein
VKINKWFKRVEEGDLVAKTKWRKDKAIAFTDCTIAVKEKEP